MSETFRKRRPGAPADYFQREADGLRWLAQADGAPVPNVVAVTPDSLSIARVPPASPRASDAQRFGAELARTHLSGASGFGAAPPSPLTTPAGFIADLPLPYGDWDSFGPFYGRARIQPYVAMLGPGISDGVTEVFTALVARLDTDDPALVGPAEPPARLHGDLWSGNVVWGRDAADDVRGWLIDPAAHGGHRETDLAMLALFGTPHLAEIMVGYQSVAPLAPGWRQRVALHQVHPLLVHAVLFGGDYLSRAASAAQTALRNGE